MPLSRIEIRRRATAFAKEWADTSDEDAEAKSFWDGFFNVFGVPRKRVATFEHHVKKLDDGPRMPRYNSCQPQVSKGEVEQHGAPARCLLGEPRFIAFGQRDLDFNARGLDRPVELQEYNSTVPRSPTAPPAPAMETKPDA